MNKKTILLLSSTILVMGLTSCNKSWPEIAVENAKERLNALLRESVNFSNLSEVIEYNATVNKTIKFKNNTLTGSYTHKIQCDIPNLYVYNYMLDDSYSVQGRSYLTEGYEIFTNNSGYILDKVSYEGEKEEFADESAWKTAKKESEKNIFKGNSYLIYYIYNYIFGGYKDYTYVIESWERESKSCVERNGYLKYTFSSDDLTKDLGLKFEKKTADDATETAPKTTEVITTEIKFVNNYPTYFKKVRNTNEEAFGDIPAVDETYVTEVKIDYAPNISRDNVNIDNYYIE